jgi:hypothetical protein
MLLSHNILSDTLARTQQISLYLGVLTLMFRVGNRTIGFTHTHINTHTQKVIFVSLVECNAIYKIFLWALSLIPKRSILVLLKIKIFGAGQM